MSNKPDTIGLFYGSTTCYTEMAAEKIQTEINQRLGADVVKLFNIKDVALSQCEDFNHLIFGISTWDFGEIQEDWESSWDDIKGLNLAGKSAVLFGLGDQIGYSEWFQDALGMLHDELLLLDCEVGGYWPTQGYEFDQSKATTEDGEYFVGLSLDDENQYEQSDERIAQWCEQVLQEWD